MVDKKDKVPLDAYYLDLSRKLKDVVSGVLKGFPAAKAVLAEGDSALVREANRKIYDLLSAFFRTASLHAAVYIAGHEPLKLPGEPQFNIFINPVDGLLNRHLGVGDPGIAFAYAEGKQPRFKDLVCGYLYCLHSQDEYFSRNGKAYYKRNKTPAAVPIQCDQAVVCLKEAVLYYNLGEGASTARAAFNRAGALPFFTGQHNALDNACAEIGQLCRGAAHLRVEARSCCINGVTKGAGHADMLLAYAIGKYAGLVVSDLEGRNLEECVIDFSQTQDFICAANETLLKEAIDIIKNNGALLRERLAVGEL